jgi:hypothetical protein
MDKWILKKNKKSNKRNRNPPNLFYDEVMGVRRQLCTYR